MVLLAAVMTGSYYVSQPLKGWLSAQEQQVYVQTVNMLY